MMQIKRINFFLVLLVFVLFACGKSTYYSKVYSFKNNKWKAADFKTFVVDVKDTTHIYDIVFFLRVKTDYDYNNAWIYLHSTLPDKTQYKEAHQFYVSNEYGEWLGKKSGSLVESEMIFGKRKFNKLGKYVFSVEQATTEKELKHVSDLGLRIVRSQKK